MLFLIVLGLVVVFAGFNAGNVADISFGFHTLEAVPIFMSLFAAFFLGALIVLPFTVFRRSKKKSKAPKDKQETSQQAKPEKKRRFGKKRKQENSDAPTTAAST
ncbi:MAG: hypothetical protein EA384_09320 [Spirochaetaceae bacterium]|nr:MAG: hypothetical protein EA384_09320 [Spirochaetaceae bacterium]